MNANELMIGDWVQYTDIVDEWGYVPQGKVSKLTHHATFDEQKGSRIQIELPDGFQFYNDIEEHFFPIPLTPEILEKNGFVLREGCTSAWDWHSNDYSVHVSGNNEQVPMNITIYVPSGWSPHGSSRLLDDLSVRYIHKLQHALRLAGIKKEIVL